MIRAVGMSRGRCVPRDHLYIAPPKEASLLFLVSAAVLTV